jgi:O-antigen ligase
MKSARVWEGVRHGSLRLASILPAASSRSLGAAIGWASFVSLLLVQFHLYFSPGPLSVEFVAGAGLLAVIVALIGHGAFSTCLDLPLVAYLATGLLSAVVHGSTLAWSAILPFVMLYYGTAFLARHPLRLRLLVASTVICQVLVGALALYYHAAVGFERRAEILYLAVPQWSGYPEVGFLQALAIPFSFAMVVAGPTRLAVVAGLVLSTSIVAIVLGLSSRGAWIAAGSGYLAVATVEILRFRRVRLALAIPLAVGVIVGAWSWSPLFQDLVLGFFPAHGVRNDRAEVWKATLLLIKDNPWLGVGPGNLRDALVSGYVVKSAAWAAFQAHNMYLHVAAERGLPGLLAFLWLWWRAMRSLARELASDDRLNLVGIGLLGAVVVFMIRGMTDHFLGGLATAPRFNAVLWTMFAMVASLDRLRKERGTTAPPPSPDNPPTIARA